MLGLYGVYVFISRGETRQLSCSSQKWLWVTFLGLSWTCRGETAALLESKLGRSTLKHAAKDFIGLHRALRVETKKLKALQKFNQAKQTATIKQASLLSPCKPTPMWRTRLVDCPRRPEKSNSKRSMTKPCKRENGRLPQIIKNRWEPDLRTISNKKLNLPHFHCQVPSSWMKPFWMAEAHAPCPFCLLTSALMLLQMSFLSLQINVSWFLLRIPWYLREFRLRCLKQGLSVL